jgi:hypothetical protein
MGETERVAPARQTQRREGQMSSRRQNGQDVGTPANIIGTHQKPGGQVVSPGQLEERIRLRAYERYVQRQGRPGTAETDWIEAEREVRSTMWGAKERPGSADSMST